jgi:hypothetical protein
MGKSWKLELKTGNFETGKKFKVKKKSREKGRASC